MALWLEKDFTLFYCYITISNVTQQNMKLDVHTAHYLRRRD